MKRMTTGWLAVLMTLVSAGSLLAHHSLTNFDTTKAVRVKGTIVQINQINPHSFIYLDEKGTDGADASVGRRRSLGYSTQPKWFCKDVLKPGDVVEVCGYAPKEAIMWQIANAETATSLAGRLTQW